jgi:hypothetical protein
VSDRTVDTDGVVGARWWNQALIEADKTTSRRGCLQVLGVSALTVVTCKVVCGDVGCDDDEVDMSLYTFESPALARAAARRTGGTSGRPASRWCSMGSRRRRSTRR